MPFPVIPVVIALVGGAVGCAAAAAINDKLDLDEVKEINDKAQEKYKNSQYLLNSTHNRLKLALQNLGRKKLDVYTSGSVANFLEVASKLKDMPKDEFVVALEEDRPISDILQEVRDIQEEIAKFSGSMLTSCDSSVLTSVASLGWEHFLGVAGIGTAISSLFGATATNATLEWLKGKTLPAGGLGVAGGTVMVGGVAVAPTFFLGGLIFSSKGEKSLEQAKENAAKADALDKCARAICENLDKLWEASAQMYVVLRSMDALFGKFVGRLESLVAISDDCRTYSKENLNLVVNCFMIYEHMKHLLETKLMDQDGKLLATCLANIEEQEKFIEDMNVL